MRHSKPAIFFLSMICWAVSSHAQSGDNLSKPEISIGAGSLTYYGDITKAQKTNLLIGRMGYQLTVYQPFTKYISGSFHMLWGSVGANERDFNRNINFESSIRMGGISAQYNFDHFLPENRNLEPYFTLGIETFEFLSKTDLYDQYGNEYFYWSDGSIRNIDETSPDAGDAVKIQRDYVYETDIRVNNADGFGKYSEMALAVPVGIGFHLKLHPKASLRVGTTMHLTFTDMVDGISANSLGNRVGDRLTDRFLYTHFSISYNISGKGSDGVFKLFFPPTDDPLIAEANTADEDGDGVIDFYDECAQTPTDAIVDEKGCPLDTDKDHVPDHVDDEPETNLEIYPVVDNKGVGIGDDYVSPSSQASTGAGNSEIVKKTIEGGREKFGVGSGGKIYMIAVAATAEGLTPELMNVLLNIPDVNLIEQDDQTIVTIGKFSNAVDAIDRREEIDKMIPGAYLVTYDDQGKLVSVSSTIGNKTQGPGVDRIASRLKPEDRQSINNVKDLSNLTPSEADGKVFRVQIGAFTQAVNESRFAGVKDVFKVKSDDGFTRYYSGTFSDYQAAAKHKVALSSQGFEGAFVVSVSGGKRIKLSEAGATPALPEPPQSNEEDDRMNDLPPANSNTSTSNGSGSSSSSSSSPANAASTASSNSEYNPQYIRFKVQVAAYSNEVPLEVHEQLMKLGDVAQSRSNDGVIKFTSGNFNLYEAAGVYKKKLAAAGFTGAFVIAEYRGSPMPVDQAKKLTSE